jgi:hypothetical protein
MSCSTISSVLPTVTLRISSTAWSDSTAHARRGFVEQDDLGAAGDGDADFQRALLGIGQQPGLRLAPMLHADQFQHLLGALARVAQRRQAMPERILVAQRPHRAAQVLEHAQPMKDVRDLEAARQPHAVDLERAHAAMLPVSLTVPSRREAADQVERGRLARAVRPDQRVPLALPIDSVTPRMISVCPKRLRTSFNSSAAVMPRLPFPPGWRPVAHAPSRRPIATLHNRCPQRRGHDPWGQRGGVESMPSSVMAVPLALSTCTL